MARGWESKAVESQQEAAASDDKKRPPMDPAEAARMQERTTVQLARTRALADLQQACNPAHRAMLERAIADLDARLATLGPTRTAG